MPDEGGAVKSAGSKAVKQVIVIRRDLKMRRGKEIAQGAHAAMAWLTSRFKESRHYDAALIPAGARVEAKLSEAERLWVNGSFRKVTCQVSSEDELMVIHDAAKAAGLVVSLITDNGYTEFHGEPTVTCLAIGPDYDERLDPVTSGLKLY